MNNSWYSRALGLTGIAGSGKSTVADIFKLLGCEIIDADKLSRESLEPQGAAFEKTIQVFGEEITEVTTKGKVKIDRRKLANLVFGDSLENKRKKKKLEELVHPVVQNQAAKLAASCPKEKLLVYDCPLLFESHLSSNENFASPFRAIAVVEASEEVSMKRYCARTGVSEEVYRKILSEQIPLATKIKYANYVIDNSGERAGLEQQVKKIIAEVS